MSISKGSEDRDESYEIRFVIFKELLWSLNVYLDNVGCSNASLMIF